jgi:hypothetical protein
MRTFEETYCNYIVQEAISLKNVRKKGLTKKYSGAYNDRLNEVFGNKNRLISNITIDYSNLKHQLYDRIDDELTKYDYTVPTMADYIKGVAYKQIFKDGKFERTDTKNPVKIGKILTKFEPEGEIQVTSRVDGKKTTKTIPGKPLLHAFKNDPIRATNGQFLVVISRHPYDIAGSSTDRSWTSCMDLGLPRINYPGTKDSEGINKKYVPKDIEEGTLVAYVVTKDEMFMGPNNQVKVKLQRPLSRILLKPHPSDVGSVYTVGKMYGNVYPEFQQKVKDWVSKSLNNKITSSTKVYRNRKLYNDAGTDQPVNFKFNSGYGMIDEIMTETLEYENEKEIGNELTFETSGEGYGVECKLTATFRFSDNIVKPIEYIDNLYKSQIPNIGSTIEKALATAVFNEMNISRFSRLDPQITMSDLGDGLELEIVWHLNTYHEDDKNDDEDYWRDTIAYELRPFKTFKYSRLNANLYKICANYDWNQDAIEKANYFNQKMTEYKEGLDHSLTVLLSLPILSRLVPIHPSELIQEGRPAILSYVMETRKIVNTLTVMWDKYRQFKDTIPYNIQLSEEYKKQVADIFYNWVKDNFKVDLKDYVAKMKQYWGYKTMVGLKIICPEDLWEDIEDADNNTDNIVRYLGYFVPFSDPDYVQI